GLGLAVVPALQVHPGVTWPRGVEDVMARALAARCTQELGSDLDGVFEPHPFGVVPHRLKKPPYARHLLSISTPFEEGSTALLPMRAKVIVSHFGVPDADTNRCRAVRQTMVVTHSFR